jgi:hypothetical protein
LIVNALVNTSVGLVGVQPIVVWFFSKTALKITIDRPNAILDYDAALLAVGQLTIQ